MGEPFRHGLLRASGLNLGDELNLNGRIDGHRPTALHAVSLLMSGGLKELNLWGNRITGAEARVLAEALAVSGGVLKVLNLGTNELGNEGAEHFAAAMPRCAALRSLDLSRNQIGVSGGKALAAAIKSSHQNGSALECCFLWRNHFDDKVKAAMPKHLVKV